MWQDAIFTIGNIVLIAALFPSLLSKNKPALATCLLTGTTLITFALAFYTLGLWFSAITITGSSILWFIFAAQVISRNK